MFAFLSAQWVKYVAILGAALAVFGGGIFVANTWYDRGAAAQKALDQKQQVRIQESDAAKITEAVHSNDQELMALRAYRDAHTAIPVSVLPSPGLSGCQAAAASGTHIGSPASTMVQPVPAADPDRYLTDADRGRLLEALAATADANSAELRGVLKVVK